MKPIRWITVLLAVPALLVSGCRPVDPDDSLDKETRNLRYYVNTFAYNMMSAYYLWRDEVETALGQWKTTDDPIAKVAEVRYKDESGKDIDRWTVLTDDFSSLSGSVSGHTRSFGLEFVLYYTDRTHEKVCAVVTYTYAGSPAEKAGFRRGDVILTLDGKEMTADNYADVVRSTLRGGGTLQAGLSDGRTVSMTAVDLYEDPVHLSRILEEDGRKVAYLHYTGFTLDSCGDLVDVMRRFTEDGVDEMVLDLRYNGGGYVSTEAVLGSMLAPPAAVAAGEIFSTEVVNSLLAEKWETDTVRFQTDFTIRMGEEEHSFSTAGANPGLKRLYCLVTGESASASEGLICSLRPYMDVILVGGQTYGKYCAGTLSAATDWYEALRDEAKDIDCDEALSYVDNWGIYVMYARYADCNGVTLSMPDGIAPDVEVSDDPLDGYSLGDPHETMLARALALIGGRPAPDTRTRGSGDPAPSAGPAGISVRKPGFGMLVGRNR